MIKYDLDKQILEWRMTGEDNTWVKLISERKNLLDYRGNFSRLKYNNTDTWENKFYI